jgi:geranylgeranyl pyrophosphate synthase
VNALAAVDATPGLAAYMAELEARLAQAVARREGFAAGVAAEALAAGGKRLRPLLCFLASPEAESDPPLAAGVATELVHMATLVHDDLVDGARMRRGAPSAWSTFGAGAALSAGDYLFACAFAELAATDDSRAVAALAEACLALARGEAMQRRQTRRPETTIDAYLERCGLKTGKLFEAACRLGSGGDPDLGAYGLALGIAFQIVDDILDCAGQTQETGKIPGTDLREGTPTMPLLLAAQQDEVVRRALAGGPLLEGALARVAATDALARSREAALDYAARARSFVVGAAHREELEALTYAVVDRAS